LRKQNLPQITKYTHKVLTQSINPQANFAFAKFAVVSSLYFVL